MRACYNNQLLYFLLYCCTKMYMLLLFFERRPDQHKQIICYVSFSQLSLSVTVTSLSSFTSSLLMPSNINTVSCAGLISSRQVPKPMHLAAETAVPAPKANRYYSRDGSSHVPGHVR
jgi:hypothetical protein